MIYVDPSPLDDAVSHDWRKRADDAAQAIAVATGPEDRLKALDDAADLWREIKPALAAASDHKCWYCEVKDIRSDYAVDHFRPKSAGARSSHRGYWWLAVDLSNFRLACTYCNSRRKDVEGGTVGGKQDQFPLMDEGARAASPTDNLANEAPMLLDPCRPDEPHHLWFTDDGQVSLHPDSEQLPGLADRLDSTVRVFHLDHRSTVRARREIYRTVNKKVGTADKAWATWHRAGDESAHEQYADLLRELIDLVASSAAFSATARCALLGNAGSVTAMAVIRQMR